MIQKNENVLRIFFSKKLYGIQNVKDACLKFKDFLECKITEDDDRIILEAKKEDETALLEMFNYIFALQKQEGV